MVDEEAARWVVRMDRGLSDDEKVALDAWIGGDSRQRGALVRAQAAWALLDRAQVLGPVNQGAHEDEAAESRRVWTRRGLWRLGASAAAAMLVIAAAVAWTPWSTGQAYATTTGEVRRLPLADGSLAMINSDSTIRVDFKRERRDVELDHGEAWFKVARNPDRPFTVAAGDVRVEAVGTAFDVRRHETFAEITVTEGVVKVWSVADKGDVTLVGAGRRAVIGQGAGVEVASLSTADLDQRLAWQEGRIVLDDMTLGAAAAEFNRYNGVKLEVAPELANEKLVGWFRFDDLEGFVSAAATLVDGEIERDEKVIRIVR